MSKLAALIGSPIWRRALLRVGVAAGAEHLHLVRSLGALQTVVDIGANRGQFALTVRHCLPEAAILAFEPLEKPRQAFDKVFAGDPYVSMFPAAIGPVKRNALMHVSRRDDSSSLLPITKQQTLVFPGTEEIGVQRVAVGRLGDYVVETDIEEPALLKFDVQGAEMSVLEGCEKLLHRFAWVYGECSFVELYEGQALVDEVISWLHDRRFRLSGCYNTMHDRNGRPVQGDFLFSRKLTAP